jgi:hypothetical protein
MNSKDYAKLVVYLKEELAQRSEFSRRFLDWLAEKDRLLVSELAHAVGGVDVHAMGFQAGRASMRQEIRQTLFPKELQDE